MQGGHNAKRSRNQQIIAMRESGESLGAIAIRFGCTLENVFRVIREARIERDLKESEMPRKVLIALPPAMLEQVDHIATCEHRTRSDLIREALRRYIDSFRRTQGIRHLDIVQPIESSING